MLGFEIKKYVYNNQLSICPNAIANQLAFVILVYILKNVKEDEKTLHFLKTKSAANLAKKSDISFPAIPECAFIHLKTKRLESLVEPRNVT